MYGPLLANRTPVCVFRPAVMETHGFMHKGTTYTLKDLARYSTNKAVKDLNIVTDAEWKVLFGFKVSMMYQLLSSVACVKAAVENINDGVQAILNTIKTTAARTSQQQGPSALASSRNRGRCDLASAQRWRDGGFD